MSDAISPVSDTIAHYPNSLHDGASARVATAPYGPRLATLSVMLAVAAALSTSPARAANVACPPNITSNTGSTLTVSNASCTVSATVNVTGGSTAGATLAGGTSTSPTTLINNGTIEISGSGSGRAVQSSGTNATLVIQNNLGATISTNNNDTVAAGTGSTSVASVSLTNAGSIISAAGGQAVNFNKIVNGAANSVLNLSSGLIQATGSDAVRPGLNGTVTNNLGGTIKSIAVNGSSSDGVDGQANSGITITNAADAGVGVGTALIEGGRHGITGGNTDTTTNGAYPMTVTNNLGGVIQGDNGSGINIDGFNANEVVTIVNHGVITGNGVTGDGDGVDVDGLVNLTNTGTIHSLNAFAASGTEFSEGVTVGGGIITNSGTIEGSVASGNTSGLGRGITLAGLDKDANGNPIAVQAPFGAAIITNSGLIKGDSDSAIIFSSALASGFSHTITNQAGGVIQTGSASAPAILTAADNVAIVNAGKIDGSSSGKAVTGGAGNLTLTVQGGSAGILGDIAGGTGTNTATFDPGAGNGFSYSGSISNFSTVEAKSGHVTLSGVSTYEGATRISGGVLTLDGANRLAASSSLVLDGGTLQIANAGGANGQTFAKLLLSDSSTIDLESTTSLTFDALGDIASGKTLSVLDWSAASSPTYAFRLHGDDTANAIFQALIGDTTIDGVAAAYSFDGTYTDVSQVPLPDSLGMLLTGLGLLGATAIGRGRNGGFRGRAASP